MNENQENNCPFQFTDYDPGLINPDCETVVSVRHHVEHANAYWTQQVEELLNNYAALQADRDRLQAEIGVLKMRFQPADNQEFRERVKKSEDVREDILSVVNGAEQLANALTWDEGDLDLPGARNFYEANELLKLRCARIREALAAPAQKKDHPGPA